MRTAKHRGSTWGYGIGLLGSLLTVGLLLWMWVQLAGSSIEAGRAGQQNLQEALRQARSATQAAADRNGSLAGDATPDAPSPARVPARAGATAPAGNTPGQMPAHDGGMLNENP